MKPHFAYMKFDMKIIAMSKMYSRTSKNRTEYSFNKSKVDLKCYKHNIFCFYFSGFDFALYLLNRMFSLNIHMLPFFYLFYSVRQIFAKIHFLFLWNLSLACSPYYGLISLTKTFEPRQSIQFYKINPKFVWCIELLSITVEEMNLTIWRLKNHQTKFIFFLSHIQKIRFMFQTLNFYWELGHFSQRKA